MRIEHPRFQKFISRFNELIDRSADEKVVLSEGSTLLGELVAVDDWLPEAYTRNHPEYYQQYALHIDPKERYSMVSFVWGPGQKTPIHNHGVWALIGMLRGSEKEQRFKWHGEGRKMDVTGNAVMVPGQVEGLSVIEGDIHRVSNSYDDRVSISVHVYGGNIGRIKRHVFYEEDGQRKDFVSGYSNRDEVLRLYPDMVLVN